MENKWEKPGCNFCGSRQYKVIWKKVTTWITRGEYQIVTCKKCGLVYLSPRPKKEYVSKYYPPETYWGKDLAKPLIERNLYSKMRDYNFIYNQILKRKNGSKILDLGAGTGEFLSEFKKLGWSTLGVELSGKACGYAKKAYGLKIIRGSFPEVRLPKGSYDVITFNGCLEHLYKPKQSLERVYKLLGNHGIVEINVPNFDSLGRLIFGKKWYALQPPSHLYYFTPVTISKTLKDIGFRNIKISHNYRAQNIYILFESIRLSFSPRFKGKYVRDFVTTVNTKNKVNISIKMVASKILARIISFIVTDLEPLIKRGEVITIYAEK